ncbi:MAG: hypothetical protein U1E49_16825 [Hyphomicrobiaceae bacterium]
MASRLQLRVLRTILDAIETLAREMWPLFRIYVVPWLGWTLALLAINRVWLLYGGIALSPDLVMAMLFAPFGAAIAVTALRWMMQPRDEFRWWRLDQTWLWTTALFALIGVVNFGITQASYSFAMANADTVIAGTQADSTPGQRLAWIVVGLLPGWIATLLAFLVLMPQVAVIVETGSPSLKREWELMRLAPWSILGVAVLIGICRLGLSFGYASVVYRLYTSDGPFAGDVYGWTYDVIAGLWHALIALPAQFLTDALALVALARVYKALAGYADRRGSATMPRAKLENSR